MKRELWVDYIKVFACALVVIGHLFQSLTKAAIIPANDLYQWFNITIYYFHVPLFFICSGYLFQKLSKVDSFESWKRNVIKKLITLGIPYLTFSTITWLMKTLFSSSVNDGVGGIADALLFHPIGPYWYLYCLFFIFMITPTINSLKSAIAIILFAVIGKTLVLVGGGSNIYAINVVLTNEIWFVAGMCLWILRRHLKNVKLFTSIVIIISFTAGSILCFINGVSNRILNFVFGVIACIGFVMFFKAIVVRENVVMTYLANYTMPIYLMHTIFAAMMRIVLLKIGIYNGMIHVIVGLGISFIGPIIAVECMEKFKWMNFFVYPGKFIKIK